MTNRANGWIFAFIVSALMWLGIIAGTNAVLTHEAFAQSSSCRATAANPTYTEGALSALSCDLSGNLRNRSGGSGGLATQVQGNSASGVADVGNPVKIGGVFMATLPNYSDGQRGDWQLTAFGGNLVGSATTVSDGRSNNSGAGINIGSAGGSVGVGSLVEFPFVFNGTTWDRDFQCNQSAVVNVTAGATTQIVALVASQQVRVCEFTLTSNVAGTAKWVYGTGSNCGTGTTDLTGAMNLTTTQPITTNAGRGSLFRTASANALCLTAVTANITGFVSYTVF